jgi:tripartite-type tricarboxylate transporter receptor subunit TctC
MLGRNIMASIGRKIGNFGFWVAAAIVAAALLPSSEAPAQSYPSRPIRIVIPFAPGTATDNLIRPLAEAMTLELKQPVVLDNKVGATGQIGADSVAKATPDGYTFLGGATTVIAANPSLFKNLPYNPKTDFDPVIGLGGIPQVVVLNPEVPAKTVAEFVAYAKQNQGKLFYGSGTAGNIIPSFVLSDRMGLGMQNVMYRSPPQALTDVIAGRLAMMTADASAVIGQIKQGSVRPIAVTSLKESALLPGVPPLADTIPGFELTVWFGLFAPKGTPKDIVQTVYRAAKSAAENPDMKRRLIEQGFEIVTSTPEELGAHAAREIDKWAVLVKEAKIEPE